ERGAPAASRRRQFDLEVLDRTRRMLYHHAQRCPGVEISGHRDHLEHAFISAQRRAQFQRPRVLVRSEVGGLDLRHPAHVIAHHVGTAAAHRDHQQRDPGDHRRQREPDHQPHHRDLPEGLFLDFVHHMGPKKLLSTTWRVLPSSLSTTKRTSERPDTPSRETGTTGTEITDPAGACTRVSLSAIPMPETAGSMVIRKARALSDLFTSLSV